MNTKLPLNLPLFPFFFFHFSIFFSLEPLGVYCFLACSLIINSSYASGEPTFRTRYVCFSNSVIAPASWRFHPYVKIRRNKRIKISLYI